MLLGSPKKQQLVGLDIEAGSVAAASVRVNGRAELVEGNVRALEPGVFHDGEVIDPVALAASLKQLFSDSKLPREVRIGVANQKVAVRTLHVPLIEGRAELEAAIRFQAAEHVPMPLDQAVLDWEVIGTGESAEGVPSLEVVVVAARRDMIGAVLAAARSAGLKPMGIDVSAFAMIRALADEASPAPAGGLLAAGPEVPAADGSAAATPSVCTYCSLGDVTNLAVARGRSCLMTRSAAFGVEGIAQMLAERRELTLEHSRQWLAHVGLASPIDDVSGEEEIVRTAREVLEEGARKLADEIRRSLEYFSGQTGMPPIDRIVLSGPGSMIPGLAERLQQELPWPVTSARPRGLEHLDEATAARLTVAYGLGLEA